MGLLVIGWLLTRVLKYQTVETNALTRYLWYCYYIFEALLPLGMLRIATLVGAGGGKRKVPAWFWAAGACDLALAALVMTNDLHGLMFKLDVSAPGWSATGNYSYGVLYYALIVVLLLQIVGGIVLMFAKARHSPRRFGAVFPFAFTAALAAYIAGYALRVPAVIETDSTLYICAYALLFLELCLDGGQIPVNTRYRALFKNAGLNLQITDGDGNVVFAPDDAGAPTGENTLPRKTKIAGGFAVWQEDVTAINRLKAEIAASNLEAEAANALLSREAVEKERDARAKARLELYAAFEQEIAPYERRLNEMLDAIPEGEAERAVYIGAAAVLVCYIKRRCYFLSLELGGTRAVPFNEYVVYIDELVELARLSGKTCLARCGLMGKLELRRARLFYDVWASLLEWSISNGEQRIVLQTVSENGRLAMKISASGNAMRYALPGKAAREIREAGGTFWKEDDEALGLAVLCLSFPEGGGGDA
jgi:hypothetical protein